MEPDKEHICHCLLFCFHQKKANTQNHLRYGENVIKYYKMFERMRIGLNDLKTMILISVTKNAPDALQLWKRTSCEKMKKSHRKR